MKEEGVINEEITNRNFVTYISCKLWQQAGNSRIKIYR